MNDGYLQGRSALVTSSVQGIGLAIARSLAGAGARIVVHGIASLLTEKQPSQRTSDPSELGAPAAWLCHRSAHNITGTSIPVDGGWTAQ